MTQLEESSRKRYDPSSGPQAFGIEFREAENDARPLFKHRPARSRGDSALGMRLSVSASHDSNVHDAARSQDDEVMRLHSRYAEKCHQIPLLNMQRLEVTK